MFKIKFTGDIFSIAGSKFEVEYPDGYVGSVWSPPWNDDCHGVQSEKCLIYAMKLYELGQHKDPNPVKLNITQEDYWKHIGLSDGWVSARTWLQTAGSFKDPQAKTTAIHLDRVLIEMEIISLAKTVASRRDV